jgi:DNA-binding NtrC family response regulator
MARNRINILLVDDNEDDSFFFETCLESANATLVHVRSREEAILYLDDPERVKPDLIVVEPRIRHGMPTESFLSWMRFNHFVKHIPLVIFTGLSLVSDEEKRAAQAMFHKPVRLEELRKTIRQICQLAGNEVRLRPYGDSAS